MIGIGWPTDFFGETAQAHLAFLQTNANIVIAGLVTGAVNLGRFVAAFARLLLPGQPSIVAKGRYGFVIDIGSLIAAETKEQIYVRYSRIRRFTRVHHVIEKIIVTLALGRVTIFITIIVPIA